MQIPHVAVATGWLEGNTFGVNGWGVLMQVSHVAAAVAAGWGGRGSGMTHLGCAYADVTCRCCCCYLVVGLSRNAPQKVITIGVCLRGFGTWKGSAAF